MKTKENLVITRPFIFLYEWSSINPSGTEFHLTESYHQGLCFFACFDVGEQVPVFPAVRRTLSAIEGKVSYHPS